ncbi:MAG: hypothetical protein Q9227_008801 [Pyrenula ochraceoflavens]
MESMVARREQSPVCTCGFCASAFAPVSSKSFHSSSRKVLSWSRRYPGPAAEWLPDSDGFEPQESAPSLIYDRRVSLFEHIQKLYDAISRFCAEICKLNGHPSPIHQSKTSNIFSTIIYWVLDQEEAPNVHLLWDIVQGTENPWKYQTNDENKKKVARNPCIQGLLRDCWGFLKIESDMTVNFAHPTYRQYFSIKKNYVYEQISRNGNLDEDIARRFDMENITRTYLEMGADPNAYVFPGDETAMHVAAAANVSRCMIKLLLERGADIEAPDGEGRSPLHVAASSGAVSCALLLIESGVNVNSKISQSYDPTKWLNNGDIHVSSNRSGGRWLSAAVAQEVDWWVIDRLLCLPEGKHPPFRPTDLLNHPIFGLTPLHVAASTSHYFVIAALVANGADIHEKTTKPVALTALDIAVNMRNDGIAAFLNCCSIFSSQILCINPFFDRFTVKEKSSQKRKKQRFKKAHANPSTSAMVKTTKEPSFTDANGHSRPTKLSHNGINAREPSEELWCRQFQQTFDNGYRSNQCTADIEGTRRPDSSQAYHSEKTLLQTPPPSTHHRASDSQWQLGSSSLSEVSRLS